MRVLLSAESVSAANDHVGTFLSGVLSAIWSITHRPYRYLASLTSSLATSLSLTTSLVPALRAVARWISFQIHESLLSRAVQSCATMAAQASRAALAAPAALLPAFRSRMLSLRLPVVALPPLHWPVLPKLTLTPASAAATVARAAAALRALLLALLRATYRAVFETHLLPNVSCALLVAALAYLYVALDEEGAAVAPVLPPCCPRVNPVLLPCRGR